MFFYWFLLQSAPYVCWAHSTADRLLPGYFLACWAERICSNQLKRVIRSIMAGTELSLHMGGIFGGCDGGMTRSLRQRDCSSYLTCCGGELSASQRDARMFWFSQETDFLRLSPYVQGLRLPEPVAHFSGLGYAGSGHVSFDQALLTGLGSS